MYCLENIKADNVICHIGREAVVMWLKRAIFRTGEPKFYSRGTLRIGTIETRPIFGIPAVITNLRIK